MIDWYIANTHRWGDPIWLITRCSGGYLILVIVSMADSIIFGMCQYYVLSTNVQ